MSVAPPGFTPWQVFDDPANHGGVYSEDSVVAIHPSHVAAEEALQKLQRAGFSITERTRDSSCSPTDELGASRSKLGDALTEPSAFDFGTFQRFGPVVWAGALAVLLTLRGSAEAIRPAIDPKADAVLKRMGAYLAQTPFFSVTADVWQDSDLASGQRIQSNRTVDLQVRRPDRFHAEVHSARRNRGFYYDGTSLTLINRAQHFHGSVDAPPTLDAALDLANERFGIALPLEDLFVSDPYRSAMGKTISGIDLGPVTVQGVPCEHLAFSRGIVDWQIWVELGATPVPRRMVITYRDESGSPEYTATLSGWDFQTKLPDSVFVFEAPAGSTKISVAEIRSRSEARKNSRSSK